ncbi:hypothetical protein KUF71_012321 [Frankliniella fusca]|uniref:Uncharacterized protein n=1 Tax=Frankliniella fusca TaxID=407009 RepID=A0AAE1HN31_9NEOP|nr:hypothetical protein KUF71_012321 [Frankliniella fusca]
MGLIPMGQVDPILISSRERVQNESCRKRLKQQEEVVVISDDEDGFVSTSVPNDTFDREINCAISASLKLNVPYLDDFDDNMNLAISESLKPTSQHRSEAQGSSKPLCVSLDTFKNKPKLVQQSHVIENKRGKSASQTLSTISSCKSLNVPLDDFDDNMNLAISESLKLCYSLDTHKNKPKLVEQSHVTENTGGKSATQTLSNIPSCKSLNVPLYAFDENMNPAISESVKPTSHQSSEAQAAFKPLNVRLDAFDDNMNLGISESLKPTSHHRSEAQGSSKPLCVSLDTFKNKPKSVQQSHVTENTGGKSASQTPPNVSSCKSLRDHDYCTASPHVLDTSVSPPLHGPFLASDSGQSGSKRTSSAVKVARKVASAPYVRPPPERPPAKRVTDDTPWDRLVALGYAKFN